MLMKLLNRALAYKRAQTEIDLLLQVLSNIDDAAKITEIFVCHPDEIRQEVKEAIEQRAILLIKARQASNEDAKRYRWLRAQATGFYNTRSKTHWKIPMLAAPVTGMSFDDTVSFHMSKTDKSNV